MQKLLVFMGIASELARLGTCDRKQVGCVIVRDGRCISWGFNGAPPGLPHCDENMHGWGYKYPSEEGKPDLYELSDMAMKVIKGLPTHQQSLIPWDYRGGTEWLANHFGCRNATHAEANALAVAAKQGISTDDSSLFTTCSPCDTCSRLIIAAGIIHVYYLEEYRDRSGVELLLAAGVTVEHLG